MGEHDNSLNRYKSALVTSGQPANNFSRPSIDYRNGGRLESTNWNTIKTSMPKVEWNRYNTTDRILNFGNTSSSLKGGGFLETMGNIAAGVSLFGGAAMAAVGIVSGVRAMRGAGNTNASEGTFSRKESKTISNSTTNAQDAMNALDSCIVTAEDALNSDDQNFITDANSNLMAAITAAGNAKRDPAGKKASAEKSMNDKIKLKGTKENECNKLKTQRAELRTALNELNTEKDALTEQLRVLKSMDTSQMTAEELSEHNRQIAELKKQIDEKETLIKAKEKEIKDLDEPIKKAEEEINDLNRQIAVYEQIIANNTTIIEQLDNNIKTGRELSDKLAAKSGLK